MTSGTVIVIVMMFLILGAYWLREIADRVLDSMDYDGARPDPPSAAQAAQQQSGVAIAIASNGNRC